MNQPSAGASLRKRFLILDLTIGIGVSLFSSLVLQLIFAYFIDGNISFAPIESTVSSLISFLTIASQFFCYAVLLYSTLLLGREDSRIFLYLGGLQALLSSLAAFLVAYLTTTPRLFLQNLPSLVLFVFLNLLLYALLLLAIRVCALLIWRGAGDKELLLPGKFFSLRHPVLRGAFLCSCIYIALSLILEVINTVRDFYHYGLPVNMEETVYIISPYIAIIAYFLIGYTVSVATCYLLQSELLRIVEAEEEAEEAEKAGREAVS